jgi:hypothetical protein
MILIFMIPVLWFFEIKCWIFFSCIKKLIFLKFVFSFSCKECLCRTALINCLVFILMFRNRKAFRPFILVAFTSLFVFVSFTIAVSLWIRVCKIGKIVRLFFRLFKVNFMAIIRFEYFIFIWADKLAQYSIEILGFP